MHTLWRDIVLVCRMIKIEHSVFALPFAFMGLFLAADGWPGWGPFLTLTVAMVAVRSFAMTFNRIADVKMDAKNPRTKTRPLVTGELSMPFAWGFLGVCASVFVLACALMNELALALSPLALAMSAGYSLTKRFTWGCHFVLGSVLGLAPVAGQVAYAATISLYSVLLFFGVTLWVAGFDILYACQDTDFDRRQGLNSVPARFGVDAALGISLLSHAQAAAFFLLAGWAAGMGPLFYLVCGFVCMILLWEHRLVKADDLSRVNVAFFTMNGFIAVLLFAGVLWDIYS